MWTLFYGLLGSLIYGVVSFAIVLLVRGEWGAQDFALAYTSQFKTIVSLGLILGTWLIILLHQNAIAQVVEAAFTKAELSETGYFSHKRQFGNRCQTLKFSAQFSGMGLAIFFFCR